MSLNKVMLIGNVGRDPEVRYIENSGNAKVATFTLATTERYSIVERFVKKGTQLYIEGRLRTRSWDDQTGNKRYTTEIMVDNLQLLGRKSDNPASQTGYGVQPQGGGQGGFHQQPYGGNQADQSYGQQTYQTAQQHQTPAPAEDLPEDDLPF